MRGRMLRRHYGANPRVRIVYSPGFEWSFGEECEVETRRRFIRRRSFGGMLIR